MSGPKPTQRAGRLVVRRLRRHGPHHLQLLVVAVAALAVLFSIPLEIVTQVPFWTGSLHGWSYLWGFVGLSLIVVPLAALGAARLRHRSIARFLRGDDVDSIEVWRAATVRLPGTVAWAAVIWGVVVIGSGITWVAQREGFSLLTSVLAATLLAMVSAGAAALSLLVLELALLPVVRAVAPLVPANFAERSWLTTRRRLMLLTMATSFTIGPEAAGLTRAFAPEHRIWVVPLVTLGLLLTYVGALLALVSSSVTRRIAAVQAAVSRVGQPGTVPRLHLHCGDEFDDLGRSFNAVVDMLEAHERELRDSRARLVAVSDSTRRQIERDLHDGAQQHLALVNLQLGQLRQRFADRPELRAEVERLADLLAVILDELRRLAHGIYPAALEHAGLADALALGAKQAGVRLMLESGDVDDWGRDVDTAIYFCCWHVMRAAHRHQVAGAGVAMGLSRQDGRAILTVVLREGGLGSPADQAEAALYLGDRLGAVGGSIAIEALPGALILRGEVPVA